MARRKYHLSIGDYTFSPIMETSVALALSYRDLHKNRKQRFPFYISFPNKNDASIWLSLSILTNSFLEDYIYQPENDSILKLAKKDKVEIFGAVGEIEHISDEKLLIKFSDQGNIPIPKKLRQHVNKAKKNLINKYKLYLSNYNNARRNRNPISKILEPKDDKVIINEEKLTSKVLLITGRGNSKKLRDILKSHEIYGEPLSDIFIENKNLLIKKDLESYKHSFDTFISDKEILFQQLILNFLKKTDSIEAELRVELINHLEDCSFLTSTFKDKLDDLKDYYGDDFPEINKIYEKYPGIKDQVPENIKAVILNEVDQIDLYKDTITGFLNSGIPVYVISDRYVQRNADLNYFDNYFSKNPDALRFNWNQKKIKGLKENAKDSIDYLDSELWNNCLRYSRQSIKITVSESCPFDSLLYESQKLIKTLSEFENIQESYYKHLYPAAYLYKNSSNKNKIILELAECFDQVLQKNEMYLDKSSLAILRETVDFLKNPIRNTKYIKENENIFSNTLPLNYRQNVYIPNNKNIINLPGFETERIIYTGSPYNEFSGKYLIDSVCHYYVPEIEVICWPIEADLTYNYLKRRLLAGYFTDNITLEWKISSDYIFIKPEEFLSETDAFLVCSKKVKPEFKSVLTEQEAEIQEVYKLKYKEYENSIKENHSYRIKCDIINFSDGSFLFLPKNSKILAQLETDDGSPKFRNSPFSELEIGLCVFKYKKDRKDLRELAKNNSVVKKAFSELEIWKTLLQSIYSDCDSDIDILEKYLLTTKEKNKFSVGNPVKNNIQRWLYDEELIAPEIENIRIILSASGIKDIDKTISSIGLAKSKVEGYIISLSAYIKKSVGKIIDKQFTIGHNHFNLDIDGVQINVERRIISSLEKSEIEIDFTNTHKILN
jgi:hypothetical protein